MAISVGQVALDLVLGNTASFKNSVSQQANSAKSVFGSAFKKIGALAAAAFSVKAITAFSKECIELGSDLAEVQNVVDVTFGQGAEKINAWAKTTSTAYGVSELSAKQYAGTMGAMLKSMGISTSAAADMSTTIAGLAGDMASFYNLDTDTAFEKIRAGISGETEPLKQLGINMSVANLEAYALAQGISTSYSKMSQSNQALLRYNYLLSVTSDAQGDFARTSDSWANQTRILKLNFDSLKSSIGQVLINALTPLLKKLNALISYANTAANAIARLFGNQTESSAGQSAAAMGSVSSSALQAADDMTNAGETAAKTAKKINASFLSVDEINVLGKNDDEESDSTQISPAVNTADFAAADSQMTKTEKTIDRIKQKLSGLWSGFSSKFSVEINAIKKTAQSLKDKFKSIWTDIKSLGNPLKEWFKTDFSKYLETVCRTALNVFGGLLDSVSMIFSDLWDYGVFPIISKFITTGLPVITQFKTKVSETFSELFDSVKEIFDTVWSDTIPQSLETVSTIFSDVLDIISDKWNTYGEPVFTAIKDAINNAKDIILNAWNGLIKPCWDTVMEYINELWDEHLKPLADNVGDFVGEFVQGALDIYNKFIAPIVEWIQEHLYPVFVFLFNNIVNLLKPVINFIVDTVNNIITVFRGIIKFVTGVFTGDWKKAWEGVKTIFSGIWSQIKNIIKLPINFIMAALENVANGAVKLINKAINAINSIHIKMPDWLGGKSIGFNIKTLSELQLPRLAQGGYLPANSPRLAMVGDNTREGEIVSPESKIREQVMLALSSTNGDIEALLSEVIKILRQILEKSPSVKAYITTSDVTSAINRASRRNGAPAL